MILVVLIANKWSLRFDSVSWNIASNLGHISPPTQQLQLAVSYFITDGFISLISFLLTFDIVLSLFHSLSPSPSYSRPAVLLSDAIILLYFCPCWQAIGCNLLVYRCPGRTGTNRAVISEKRISAATYAAEELTHFTLAGPGVKKWTPKFYSFPFLASKARFLPSWVIFRTPFLLRRYWFTTLEKSPTCAVRKAGKKKEAQHLITSTRLALGR